ncbi:Ig-like domain-containing protein [Clostridium saccharobutylicum]|uniref:Discoidin/Ig-like domain protein n=1 Tax=Clostridium saccharobutylicum DSM 13864 TaxID=1345695 RepID=U5MUC7_CLOSA|nr:Ig-like domain-containing protein [Clostridium saccharobutylicum]AGX43266.1 discoidin/Ig-like domain protein [Clostridium saccharobutylicum DSM 13864]AQR90566.1 bacterial Ig-like domain protein [Clostridium saccharobutylicum]AQS00470.1 bacterial Ig-like domain protein [Clostridium saccharobutylicum]AQS10120.1 bacterial Ig-like domain protein [Clostridium saccharobutylicum]AQS14453.1 bacterial Ig-like domain protein [Clostridium saccharobutylicum]
MKNLKYYIHKIALVFFMALIFGVSGNINAKAEDISNKYINAVPIMTSNTGPSGIASCDDNWNNTQAYKAFDGVNSYYYNSSYHAWGTHNTKGKLSYEFPQKKVISAYALDYNHSSLTERPKEWTFEGWDGSKWVVLDSRTVTDWQDIDKRIFEINNTTAYTKYQINIASNNGATSYTVNLSIDELELLEKTNNSSISLDKLSMNLNVGESQQLTATTTPASVGVTWSSSDTSVATVDSTGKVTGVKEGQAIITATTADGLTATCTATVTNTSGTSGGNTTPTNSTDNTGGTSTGTDETSTIVNIAHAKGDNTNNAGGEVSIIFHGTADTTLSVVKTADVKEVWVGDKFIYTIVVTNTGSKTAKAVVVNDTAPNHIQFIPSGITTTQGTVDSTSTPSNIVVNVGDIPPSGTVTIKVPVNVVL